MHSFDPFMLGLGIAFVAIIIALIVSIILAVVFAIIKGTKYSKSRLLIPSTEELVRSAILGVFGPGVFYEPNGHLANDPKMTNLLDSYDKVTQNDHIYGQYRGLDFEMVEASFQNWRTELKCYYNRGEPEWRSEQVSYSVFYGRWMVVRSQKVARSWVRVFNKNAADFEKERLKSLKKAGREVEMEDIEFNRQFTVFAYNPQDAFYVLTPKFMERLKVFNTIKAADDNLRLYVAFYCGMIHIGFGNVFSCFDSIRTFAKDEADARATAYERLRPHVSILESLVE